MAEPFIIIGTLFMLVFWGAIIYLLVALVGRARSTTDTPSYGGRRSLEVLEELYARGEIDRDEFLERRNVLLGGAEPHG